MTISLPPRPRLTGATAAGLDVIIMGTCQVEGIAAAATRFGHTANHLLLQSLRYAAVPKVDLGDHDAAVVGLTLRHIFHDATNLRLGPADMAIARLQTNDQAEDLLDGCAEMIDRKLRMIQEAVSGGPVFLTAFLEPSFNYLGALIDPYAPNSPRHFVRELNRRFAGLVRQRPNFYFIDINDIASLVGRAHLHDDTLNGSAHASFIDAGHIPLDGDRLVTPASNFDFFESERYAPAFAEAFWSFLADALEILRQPQPVKLIIVDLDDTLWRGVAAEDDRELWMQTEGWPIGFIEALLFYKRRGGLLAICSKNEESPTLGKLASIWRGAIAPDDFASIRINWRSKAENIADILAETNLLPESALFIDDNPRELDEVRARFPEIRVLGGRPHDWRRIILQSPETQVRAITDESSRRTALVRARVTRVAPPPEMSREEWLVSLNLRQSIFSVRSPTSPEGARAFELLNKTNQFNTTGKRWTLAEFEQFLGNEGVCLVTDLRDRHVDNGIIGVALVRDGEIVQAVLSCRVFGLGAEIAMGHAATRIALTQARVASAKIADTGRNMTAHGYFEQLGFHRIGDTFQTDRACAPPDWISVTMVEQPLAAADC